MGESPIADTHDDEHSDGEVVDDIDGEGEYTWVASSVTRLQQASPLCHIVTRAATLDPRVNPTDLISQDKCKCFQL